jgi:CRISPR-associated protein Cmr3
MAFADGILAARRKRLMWLFIEPSDVLFFRTSRPFNAGESGYLTSLFPPTPETVQGAIRARVAANYARAWKVTLAEAFNRPVLQELIGNHKVGYGSFRVHGLMLGKRDPQEPGKIIPLFPPPAHLLRGEDTQQTYRLAPCEPDAIRFTNVPDDLWLLEPEGDCEEKLGDFTNWLTFRELHTALSGNPDEVKTIKGIPSRKLFTFEPRLGIGMSNATKTALEGFLYQISFVRLKPGVGLLVEVGLKGIEPKDVQEKLKLDKNGWLALGGERRAASFEVLETPPVRSSLELASGRRTCLYFVTPTYFKGGWKPDDWKALMQAVPVAAAVSHARLIGGWKQDPANSGGMPKELRRCVPAGSVYFFDSPIKEPGPFTDGGSEIGYGVAYKGAW